MSAEPLLVAPARAAADSTFGPDDPLVYQTVVGGPLDHHHEPGGPPSRLSTRRERWGAPRFSKPSKAGAADAVDGAGASGSGHPYGAMEARSRRGADGRDGAATVPVAVVETPSLGNVKLRPMPSLTPLQDTGIDPFESNTPWSCYEVFKTLIVGVTLFPIRLGVLITSLMIGWFFVTLSGCCLTAQAAARRPFGCLRMCLKQPMAYICRIIMWCLGFWWIKTKRSRNRRSAGIIVSNHISLNDVFMHIWKYLPSALSKLSVASLPIVSSGAKAMQTIFIDRKSAASRTEGLELLRARARDSRFPPILIFPEGTTTNGHCLIDFKRGAFVPAVTVQPIVIKYPCHHYNPADTGRHSGNKSLFWLMLQFANWIEVTELDPYTPTPAEAADPLLFAKNVRAVMAAALKVPVTDHSYHDYLVLFDKAQEAKVPQTFTLADCRRRYGLHNDQVAAVLEHWKELDGDGDGLLTLSEVMHLLQPFATEPQRQGDIVRKAAMAAYNCANSTTRRVSQVWAEDEVVAGDGGSHSVRFDFPTAVHARALMHGHTVGYGTSAGPTAVPEVVAASAPVPAPNTVVVDVNGGLETKANPGDKRRD